MKTSALVAFALIVQTNLAFGMQEKEYYQSLDAKSRNELLSRVRVKMDFLSTESSQGGRESDKNNFTEKIDVVKYLSETCGFDYSRDQNGLPLRPQLECEYTARPVENGFNGMTAKFDCKFEKINAKGETIHQVLKVKYDPFKQAGGGHKEIPQAIMGTLMARLMGFYTNSYCPADVVCRNCPSDNPWETGKSASPAAIGSRVLFKDVVIEAKTKAYRITEANQKDPVKVHGFNYKTELSRRLPADRNLADRLKIEREALMMWVNFAKARDAGTYNTKLYCLKSTPGKSENETPTCALPVGFLNDYGNSFGYKTEREPIRLSRFDETPLFFSMDRTISTGANGTADFHNQEISAAGRQLFAESFESITDKQMDDILRLAQIETVSDASIGKWKSVFRKKIRSIRD